MNKYDKAIIQAACEKYIKKAATIIISKQCKFELCNYACAI